MPASVYPERLPELCQLTLVQMLAGLDRGDFSHTELWSSHQRQIARLNPLLNAFNALQEATAAVPYSLKDCFATDALCIQRLQTEGFAPLGRTNIPDFLMNWETFSGTHGITRNPWDPARTPGGSSGGESAAIASCMSPGGIGSDGGGSIRLPASLTGICGLKPTPGRISGTGHIPGIGHPGGLLGVIGPMARTVADVRVLFNIIEGHHDSDPFSVPFSPLPLPSPCFGIVDHPTTRLALPFLDADCDEFPAQPWPRLFKTWEFFFLRVNAHAIGIPTPHTAKFLAEAPPSALDMLEMFAARDALRLRFLRTMDRFPIVVMPNPGMEAWPIGEFPGVEAMAPLTVANILGLPALTVPIGLSENGLPLSVQLVAKPWHEELLLATGEKLEEARGAFPLPHLATQS